MVSGREIRDVSQVNDEKASIIGLTSNDGAIHRMKTASCGHVKFGPSFVSLVNMDLYGKRAISAFLEGTVGVNMYDHKRVHNDTLCKCYPKS